MESGWKRCTWIRGYPDGLRCTQDAGHIDGHVFEEADEMGRLPEHPQYKKQGDEMYSYAIEKPKLFTDENQRMLLKVRDHVLKCLKTSGAVRMQEAMEPASGDSWTMLALVDRLVELGDIREIPQGQVSGQYRIFVAARQS